MDDNTAAALTVRHNDEFIFDNKRKLSNCNTVFQAELSVLFLAINWAIKTYQNTVAILTPLFLHLVDFFQLIILH